VEVKSGPEAGKQADVGLLNAPNLEYLDYHFGINHTFGVIKKGKMALIRITKS
jgi:imidazolonepropionase